MRVASQQDIHNNRNNNRNNKNFSTRFTPRHVRKLENWNWIDVRATWLLIVRGFLFAFLFHDCWLFEAAIVQFTAVQAPG